MLMDHCKDSVLYCSVCLSQCIEVSWKASVFFREPGSIHDFKKWRKCMRMIQIR